MPSAISHVATAVGIAAPFYQRAIPKRVWLLGAACAVIPDADVIMLRFGVSYESFWGHRGFSHSLVFALLLSGLVTVSAFRSSVSGTSRWRIWTYLFLATASHGVLDAFTNGGGGVALLAPFDDTRYWAPIRPILVSPLSVRRFLTQRGLSILANEALWIWLPISIFAAITLWWRRRGRAAVSAPPRQ